MPERETYGPRPSPARKFELITGEFRASPWRTAKTAVQGKPIIIGRNFRVKGSRRINVRNGRLMLGTNFYGFADPRMGGLLRVAGRMEVNGAVSIAHGNRWEIGPDALVKIGSHSYFSPQSRVMIFAGLTVGTGCAVAWDCQFLDDDQHLLASPGRPAKVSAAPIELGNRVWVASGCTVLRGTRLGDGCVVAAGTVVRGDFSEPACLIAGTPARIIRRDVLWGEGLHSSQYPT